MDELVLAEARQAIHARRIEFRSFLEEHHLKADLANLLPFTQWVTPITAPRYDAPNTDMFIGLI
jgi:hypothetical protein